MDNIWIMAEFRSQNSHETFTFVKFGQTVRRLKVTHFSNESEYFLDGFQPQTKNKSEAQRANNIYGHICAYACC